MDKYDTSKDKALTLFTSQDLLKKLKSEFYLPEGYLYFSAHQLGPMSKRVKAAMFTYMDSWQLHANGGWNKDKWLDLEDSVVDKLA